MNPKKHQIPNVNELVERMSQDRDFYGLSNIWKRECIRHRYPYLFSWLGIPIIQIPQDIYAVQELVWKVSPDLIIETGVAHGGSLILSASLLTLLNVKDTLDTKLSDIRSRRRVIGIEIEMRENNREAIKEHFLSHMIDIVEGSSTDPEIVKKVYAMSKEFEKVMVFLDSNHTHEHVFNELVLYAPLVSPGSYCVVWDTGIEDLPEDFYVDRPWGKGNNPMTAVRQFLNYIDRERPSDRKGRPMTFVIDSSVYQKIVITAAPYGFLKRVP